MQRILSAFTCSLENREDRGMRLSTSHGSIAADHFLMDLLRTQIPLGAVVGRGDVLLPEEEKQRFRCFGEVAPECALFSVSRRTLLRE